MKMNRNFTLEELTIEDERRRALSYVLYTGSYLIATDGHVFARVKVVREEDDPKEDILIHRNIFHIAKRLFTKKRYPGNNLCINFLVNDMVSIGIDESSEYLSLHNPYYDVKKFPDYKFLLENLEEEVYSIRFNPHLFHKLVKALHITKSVTLKMGKPTKPILINSNDNKEEVVLLMPMRDLLKPMKKWGDLND